MTGTGFSFDKEKLHINVARLKRDKDVFEIVIDPDKAMEYKAGKNVFLNEVLMDEAVFTDARKGLRASEHKLKEIFGTEDVLEVAKIILSKGEVQETSEHRARLQEEKKRKILNIIHRNCADPKTHLPHPLERIEAAMEEAKVKIDHNRTPEEQVEEIIKQLRVIIPIKMESKQIDIIIPSQYGAKCYGVVSNYGKMLKDEWLNDGSWHVIVEMPSGLELEFYDKLNSMTHGSVESKVIATK